MLKSLNAWSVPSEVSFEDMFRALSKAGFDGVELNVDKEDASAHALSLSTTKAQLEEIRGLSEKYALPVCSISTSLCSDTFGSADRARNEMAKKIVRQQLFCAQQLGGTGILVVPGGHNEKNSLKAAYDRSFETLSALKAEIDDQDVKVGVENVWNNFFASPFDMARFIDSLGAKNIGAYFDVGNVMIFSDPVHWIEILGNRIVKIHVKDFLKSGWNAGTFVNLLEGSVPFERVVPALRAVGYDGYLTAELSAMPKTPEYLYDITVRALEIICAY